MEALAAGLGVVVTEWGAANLDMNKDFISVIPESKVSDIDYVESQIVTNREYSVNNREEIYSYAQQFDWVNIIRDTYIPTVEKIIQQEN